MKGKNMAFHKEARTYKTARERLKTRDEINPKNIEHIQKFLDFYEVGGGSTHRLLFHLFRLKRTASHLDKDFKECEREDIDRALSDVLKEGYVHNGEKRKYSRAYSNDLIASLKQFYKWLMKEETVPRVVSHLKERTKQEQIDKAELISREEFDKIYRCAKTPRDKAFLSILYFTGARIGEIGNIKIRDIVPKDVNENTFLNISVDGKTGKRVVLMMDNCEDILEWISQHPTVEDVNSHLFVTLNRNTGKHKLPQYRPLIYPSLVKILQSAVKNARESSTKRGFLTIGTDGNGNPIPKRIYPHLFRHSWATRMLLNKYRRETINNQGGWSKSSRMLENYGHLDSEDAHNELLQSRNIEPMEQRMPDENWCLKCDNKNPQGVKYCGMCGMNLKLPAEYSKVIIEKETETLQRLKFLEEALLNKRGVEM